MDNATQVQFLGSDQGESFAQIETHLVAKYANGARSGSVVFFCTVFQNMIQQLKIGAHKFSFYSKVAFCFKKSNDVFTKKGEDSRIKEVWKWPGITSILSLF